MESHEKYVFPRARDIVPPIPTILCKVELMFKLPNSPAKYRMTPVVEYLGWVDLDLGSSPAGGPLL